MQLLRKNWALVGAAFLAFLTAALVFAWLIRSLFGEAASLFVAGGGVTASIWGVWGVIDHASGAKNWSAGSSAEAMTGGALSKLQAHETVHGLRFFGFDVDHVVVGRSGVSAVETKWTTRDLDLTSPKEDRWLGDDLAAARRGAKKIESLLRGSARLDVRVRPVLIYWGAGVADVPGGSIFIDGVEVLIGRQKKQWGRTAFAGEILSEWDQRAALETLSFREQNQV